MARSQQQATPAPAPLVIHRAYIRLRPDGTDDFWFEGVLPGQRRVRDLTASPAYATIIVRDFWGQSAGMASLSPDTWRLVARKARVIYHPTYAGTGHLPAITRAQVENARARHAALADCPAVTDRAHVHPDYRPVYNGVAWASEAARLSAELAEQAEAARLAQSSPATGQAVARG